MQSEFVCDIELGQSSKLFEVLFLRMSFEPVRYQGRFFMEVNHIVLPRKNMNVGTQPTTIKQITWY